MTLIFNLIKLPLLKFFPQGVIYLKHFRYFLSNSREFKAEIVPFTRCWHLPQVSSWLFTTRIFDWCMYSRTRDLIKYMETLSSRACNEKTDISQVINKQQLPSSVTLLERYAYDIYGTFFPCLNTREVGKFLKSYANPWLRVGFAQLYQILLTSSRVQMRVCKKAS